MTSEEMGEMSFDCSVFVGEISRLKKIIKEKDDQLLWALTKIVEMKHGIEMSEIDSNKLINLISPYVKGQK